MGVPAPVTWPVMLPTVSTGSARDGFESLAAIPLVPVVAFAGSGCRACWGCCVDLVHEAAAHATLRTTTVVLTVPHTFIRHPPDAPLFRSRRLRGRQRPHRASRKKPLRLQSVGRGDSSPMFGTVPWKRSHSNIS